MNTKATILLPTAAKILAQLGEDIRLARLRRKLSAEQVAERADISRTTLWLIEKVHQVLRWEHTFKYYLYWV